MSPTETAALLGSGAALLTVLWKVITDHRAANSGKIQTDSITAQTVLQGFDLLVAGLRSEVVRVRSDAAEAERREEAREAELLAQIERLRAEIELLRKALRAAGLSIPDGDQP